MATFRDEKRERTRAAIVDAATTLFLRDGYEQTRIADIATAADVGLRTFFSYFASKDELLFPDATTRIDAAIAAIDARTSTDTPATALIRALDEIGVTSTDLVDERAALRMSLIRDVPAVAGRGQQIQREAKARIAAHLQQAYPNELDQLSAAAMVGAFVGAIDSALQVVFDDPTWQKIDRNIRRRRIIAATRAALKPWG
ncbi:MAG TPA: TetR/AcrR family transcriptional regulator [Galbitalea sp.]|nr:TetR/AcrR family transcriptional regulator [Galbitalea sp.]